MKTWISFLFLTSTLIAQPPKPARNYMTHNCKPLSLVWMADTDQFMCLAIGPTLRWSTVNGRDQLDVTSPGVTTQSVPAMATQLGDLATTLTNPTLLTLGANCSVATPCNVAWGEAVAQFTTAGLIALTGGGGIARIYVDGNVSPPVIRISLFGGLTVNCSNISCVTDTANAFPVNSIPLSSWTASAGTWDAQGGIDYRGMLRSFRFVAGPGISLVNLNGTVTISADPASISPPQ